MGATSTSIADISIYSSGEVIKIWDVGFSGNKTRYVYMNQGYVIKDSNFTNNIISVPSSEAKRVKLSSKHDNGYGSSYSDFSSSADCNLFVEGTLSTIEILDLGVPDIGGAGQSGEMYGHIIIDNSDRKYKRLKITNVDTGIDGGVQNKNGNMKAYMNDVQIGEWQGSTNLMNASLLDVDVSAMDSINFRVGGNFKSYTTSYKDCTAHFQGILTLST